MIKVSIITINKNNASGLKKTIDSVISQTYMHIEYIIIDGGSSDESVDNIRTVDDHRLVYWISEPDTGLYNGMNKGLQRATGDYVIFINSGDYLYDKYVIDNLIRNSDYEDIVYGNLCILKEGKTQIVRSASEIYYHAKYQHNIPPHPVLLVKRDLMNKLEGFDENYKVIADVVLIATLFSDKARSYKFVNIPVTVFDMNGVSSNPQNQIKIYNERKSFIEKDFPAYLEDFEKVYSKPNIFEKIIEKIRKCVMR